eukprot:187678-Pelagomonas_calceolata.AAC.2
MKLNIHPPTLPCHYLHLGFVIAFEDDLLARRVVHCKLNSGDTAPVQHHTPGVVPDVLECVQQGATCRICGGLGQPVR